MSHYEGTEGRLRQTRTVRRVKAERLPFVPYGVVPVVALGALFLFALGPFAYGVVQLSAERAAAEALADLDAAWATPRASGQWVTLEGAPPSRQAAEGALKAVRQATSQTLFGRFRPVTRIRGDFDWDGDTSGAASSGINWSYRLADGVLSLNGDMPDNDVRDQIVTAARARIDPPRLISVQDSLSITNDQVPNGFMTVAMRGINTVTRCDRGVASFNDNRFSLSCELPGVEAASVREVALAPIPMGEVGAVDIMAREAVESCESSLADLLQSAKIEFGSSSAVIDASSASLLDEVVEAVRACPGILRIEGHTDSTGVDLTNQLLSQTRAEAVRNALIARGVPPSRLVAEGLGAARPIATNQTPEGRAQNRRIEIRVIRASE